MVESFSGDYRVMRVCFANSNPLQTYYDLHHTISYRMFYDFLEMLDAKQVLDEEAQIKSRRRAEQEAEKQQRQANKGM